MSQDNSVLSLENEKLLIAIIGPTGVGKTAISLDLAQKFNGEIISADSRLFYRGMDIGTDKPDMVYRQLVPHHLIDIRDPDETVTLGQYLRLAADKIADVQSRQLIPFVVGGTGQYIKAILEGWRVPEVPPNEPLREELRKLGAAELYRWLSYLDPDISEVIDERNMRRTIRALEVILTKGQPMSMLQQKAPPNFNYLAIGLTLQRELLYKRIDDRVDSMMANGFLEEIINIRKEGYSRMLPSMSGLGYKQLWSYLCGEESLEQAVERIKFATHKYVRQQNTWFQLGDRSINWFDMNEESSKGKIEQLIEEWLSDKPES